MKIVFFGTPDYVIPVLNKLYKYYEIAAVVTQPPRPAGRKKIKIFSPVDDWAHKRKIPIFFDFSDLPSCDLGICAAFGLIIPKSVISKFKYGIINIHPSLLPLYRGASPIQTAIANNETQTGVSFIKMDEKMDHGPILTQFKEEILPNDTFQSLRERLFLRSAEVLVTLIPNYVKNKVTLKKQDDSKATFTKIIKRGDGCVDLKKDTAKEIELKLRAYSPWPGIWTFIKLSEKASEKRLKIIKAHIENEKLILDEVQLEGKKPVSWSTFNKAYPDLILST